MHEHLGARGEDVPLQIGAVEPGNVPQHHQVAVQVDDLLVLREHGSNEKAVIRHHREVVDVLEAGLDILDLLGDVHEVDGKALPLVTLDQVDVFLLDACVEDDETVGVRLGCVMDEGGDGDVQEGDVLIVGGEKDGDLLADTVTDVMSHGLIPPGMIRLIIPHDC